MKILLQLLLIVLLSIQPLMAWGSTGHRIVGKVAAFCWGGGFLIGSIGIINHQLWLIYLGYGVIGGCGLGLGYVSPVSTLIRWFPVNQITYNLNIYILIYFNSFIKFIVFT